MLDVHTIVIASEQIIQKSSSNFVREIYPALKHWENTGVKRTKIKSVILYERNCRGYIQ